MLLELMSDVISLTLGPLLCRLPPAEPALPLRGGGDFFGRNRRVAEKDRRAIVGAASGLDQEIDHDLSRARLVAEAGLGVRLEEAIALERLCNSVLRLAHVFVA